MPITAPESPARPHAPEDSSPSKRSNLPTTHGRGGPAPGAMPKRPRPNREPRREPLGRRDAPTYAHDEEENELALSRENIKLGARPDETSCRPFPTTRNRPASCFLPERSRFALTFTGKIDPRYSPTIKFDKRNAKERTGGEGRDDSEINDRNTARSLPAHTRHDLRTRSRGDIA